MKSFDLVVEVVEPFTLGGVDFTPRAGVPYRAYLKKLRSIQGVTPEESDQNLEDFLCFLVVKDDRQKLHDLLNADEEADHFVTEKQVTALVNWLIELNSGKPQTSTGSSTNGAEPTPELLKVLSSDSPVAS